MTENVITRNMTNIPYYVSGYFINFTLNSKNISLTLQIAAGLARIFKPY